MAPNNQQKPPTPKEQLIAVVILVVLGFAFYQCLSGSDSGSERDEARPRGSEPAERSLGIGDTGRATYGPGSTDDVWIAATEEVLDRMTRAATARDAAAYAELELAGLIFPVEDGTRVRVLDLRFLKTQVRVDEGPQAGRSGWLAREHVVP
jgi:hypothetical protein